MAPCYAEPAKCSQRSFPTVTLVTINPHQANCTVEPWLQLITRTSHPAASLAPLNVAMNNGNSLEAFERSASRGHAATWDGQDRLESSKSSMIDKKVTTGDIRVPVQL